MPATKETTAAAVAPKKKNRLVAYVNDTIAELKKVTWLSRRELFYLTGMVLLVTVVIGVVLGGIDWGFSKLVNWLVSLG